jgi:hypothetical protein
MKIRKPLRYWNTIGAKLYSFNNLTNIISEVWQKIKDFARAGSPF